MFIALQSGRVVGMAATRVLDVTTVELAGITVLQTLLGRGIGTPLLEAAIRSADESGFERMVVKTKADNERALAFYRNRGFVATRTFVEDVEGVPIELTALTRTL
jgi:ribosomal protein S18 acetylase RimI-like enzyme